MRVWLADLLMLGGACAVVAGSPFGLAWYIVPPLIAAGIGAALLGLAAAPGWWRAAVFAGIALSWLPVGLVILIGLAVGRFVWPGRRAADRRLVVADSLVLVSGGCLVIGVWYGGWMVPLAIGAAAAVASFLLGRRSPWRAALLVAVLVLAAASLCTGDGGGTGESTPIPRSGAFHGEGAVAQIASPRPGLGLGAARPAFRTGRASAAPGGTLRALTTGGQAEPRRHRAGVAQRLREVTLVNERAVVTVRSGTVRICGRPGR